MGREITISQNEENWLLGIIKNKENRHRIYNGDLISSKDIIPEKIAEFNNWIASKI